MQIVKMRKPYVLFAAASVLGLAASAHAGAVVLPYTTNFTTAADSNGDKYTAGQLEGQGHNGPTDSTSSGWIDETGEPTNVASVNLGGGSITLNAAPNSIGPSEATAYSDVYNSNLADHPAAGTNGNGTGVPLNPASYGNLINVSYKLNVNTGGSAASGTNSDSKASFGVEILGSDDQVIASLFNVSNPDFAGEVDGVVNEGQGNAATLPNPLIPSSPGSTGNYSINLNFNNQTFTVFVNGTKSGTYQFANTGESQIGGIAFATDNFGTNSAVFSNLSVVPEPASIGMLTIGGLILLGKRRRKQIA